MIFKSPQNSTSNWSDLGIYTKTSSLLAGRIWAKKLKLFSRMPARSMLLGETKSRYRGRGMEFEEVRPYMPGDDVRNIDWRVSARTNGTYTKLFCEERERPVHIIVDQRSSMFFGSSHRFKSVIAAEIASAICWAALASSDRIGGQVIGDNSESDIRAKRTKQAATRFIHDLNKFNHRLPTDPGNLDQENQSLRSMKQVLEECRRIVRPGTAVFIISDFHDFCENSANSMINIGRHADLHLIKVTDSLEQTLPSRGLFSISDGKENSQINFDQSLVREFERQAKNQYQRLVDASKLSRAILMEVRTDSDPRTFLTKAYGG